MSRVYLLCLGFIVTLASNAQEQIRLNQVGYYTKGPKVAILVPSMDGPFYIARPDHSDTLFKGNMEGHLLDFSAFQDTGIWVLLVPGVGSSYTFRVSSRVYASLARAVVKAFYFQRASTPLPEAFAGPWHRPEGHPDTAVRVHASAASAARPEGTVLSSPGGWYDAGDYNKYIVNSGISMGTLLGFCEDFPGYVSGLHTQIPEPDRGVPDLPEEILWNLRWMLTMQDPADGGVYHKLTNAVFDAFVMPDRATSVRFVVAKSTAATLDFAAVMAQASRVFRSYHKALPGLSDSCLSAASKAWSWAIAHPSVLYEQEVMNRTYAPVIKTGTYGDRNVSDEFAWAAAELYICTGQDDYGKVLDSDRVLSISVPTWSNVRTMGYYALLRHAGHMGPSGSRLVPLIRARLLALADAWEKGVRDQAYHTVMGERIQDYTWGGNSVAANEGILLLEAFRLTKDSRYYRLALTNLDYLLGRNATGYCFVTGQGTHNPLHPHHRISAADGVTEPVPGLLVGGPNPGRQDGSVYPSTVPDQAYSDQTVAYASNEIAINWNAPLVYLVCACEALQGLVK